MKKIFTILSIAMSSFGAIGQVTFSPPINTTFFHSQGVTTGDFNNDGKQDIASTISDSAMVSIFIGNGSGGFSTATNYPIDSFPLRLISADFNNDGKLDLATANSQFGTVSILLGNGTGGFGTSTNFQVGTGANSLAKGDFNGDNKVDLAISNSFSNNISVLLGNGIGGFGTATSYSAGNSPSAIVSGDFNGDNKVDLAIANQTSNNVSILLGNGNGTFSSPNNLMVDLSPLAIVKGDFNNDGKQDLATANSSGFSISILLGDGTGNFSNDTINLSSSLVSGPQAITVNDFDLDGKQDIVVSGVGTVSTFIKGNGNGIFNTFTDFQTGSYSLDNACADFNNDTKMDLAIANLQTYGLTVVLNNSVPTLIDNLNSNLLSIYPNPSNGKFILDMEKLTNASNYAIYDILGNLVLQQSISNEKTFVDISNQTKGFYLIKILTEDRSITGRIIKE